MYKYINRKGDRIQVDSKHIDAAIKIKEELQKQSPSRRTNWNTHRKMMRAEGFYDSDSNDAYRCMVKYAQKKRGVLPSKTKTQRNLNNPTLKSIQHEIGELNATKLEMQTTGRNVRKLVRDVNKDLIFFEEINDAISKKEFIRPSAFNKYKPNNKQKQKEMIVCLSDIHYGALVNIAENYYDTSVCAELLDSYADKVIELIHKENVKSVYIMNIGDIVENAYMRNQNLYTAQETLSEQIVNVTDLIINFIEKIDAYVPVKYSAIAGNHDRLQGKKDSNLNADHVVRVSNKIIEVYAKHDPRLTYIKSEDYIHFIKTGKFNFCFVHGDLNNLQKQTTLSELAASYGQIISCLIGGHIHHFTMKEVGNNQYQITFGSIKGVDDYSVRINRRSCRSQGVVIIDEDDYEIRKINL